MVETTNLSKGFEVRARDEVERLTAERQIRSVFLQAVDLKFQGNVDLNTFTSGGALRAFDSDAYWGLPSSIYTLALFWRDAQVSAPAPTSPVGMTTKFAKTGVFFQMPTAKTWGVLYIDLGAQANLAPDQQDLFFEGLVGLKIKNVQTFRLKDTDPALAPGSPVTSFDIEMTFRKFISPQGQVGFVFCPRAKMDGSNPDCIDKTPSRDVNRTIRVIVRNNILTLSPSANLNLALPLPPGAGARYGARAYDRIHFFKPYTPSGLL
jgi:hypothetical protein